MLKTIRLVSAGVVLSLVITAMQSGVFTAENACPHSVGGQKADPDLRPRRTQPHNPRAIAIIQRGE